MTLQSKLYADDEAERWFHLYHSIRRESAERTHLENELRRMEEAMNKCKGKEAALPKKYTHYYELTCHEKNGKQQSHCD